DLAICVVCIALQTRPPLSSLFPYTTLFRSWKNEGVEDDLTGMNTAPVPCPPACRSLLRPGSAPCGLSPDRAGGHQQGCGPRRRRSEEHTSELQSRENLVCRLLLEKKKNKKM